MVKSPLLMVDSTLEQEKHPLLYLDHGYMSEASFQVA